MYLFHFCLNSLFWTCKCLFLGLWDEHAGWEITRERENGVFSPLCIVGKAALAEGAERVISSLLSPHCSLPIYVPINVCESSNHKNKHSWGQKDSLGLREENMRKIHDFLITSSFYWFYLITCSIMHVLIQFHSAFFQDTVCIFSMTSLTILWSRLTWIQDIFLCYLQRYITCWASVNTGLLSHRPICWALNTQQS